MHPEPIPTVFCDRGPNWFICFVTSVFLYFISVVCLVCGGELWSMEGALFIQGLFVLNAIKGCRSFVVDMSFTLRIDLSTS